MNPMSTSSVKCVFFEGPPSNIGADILMLYELSPWVHAEVWVNGTSWVAAGGGRTVVSEWGTTKAELMSPFIDCVDVPVKDAHKAVDFLEKACLTHARFDIPVLDFLFPALLVDWVDKDDKDECMHPEAWRTLYCSKFVLFFLRHCHREGALDVTEESMRPLWTVNSNRCSPAVLRSLVKRAFVRPKPQVNTGIHKSVWDGNAHTEGRTNISPVGHAHLRRT